MSGTISLVVDTAWPERLVELWSGLRPRLVIIPGGRTPVPLFQALRPAAQRLELDATEFFFSDERCVPPSHRDSNFGCAYRMLFSSISATVHRMPSETCSPGPYARALVRRRIDLSILGVGEDGHTASIFAGSDVVGLTGEDAPLVVAAEGPRHKRLTLTPRALNSSRVVAYLASGEAKSEVVARLCRRDPLLVASAISGREATYLFCDPAAAGGLKP